MRDKVIQWRVAVSGKNCLQEEEKVERKWVSASDNLTSTFPLIIAAFMDPICCRKENSFPFWGDMYSKLDCTWDYSCLLNCAQIYGWKLWLKVMAKRNYDCCIIVILELWYRVDLRILVAFTSLQSKGQKQMPVSLLKDKRTNACFNLKRQTNKCLFQS